MPQQLIPTNLPLYYECLCVPAEWGPAAYPKFFRAPGATGSVGRLAPLSSALGKVDPDTLEVRVRKTELHAGNPKSFDPWEKRNEFFRLKSDDRQALLKFLNTVGLFKPAVPFTESETITSVLVPSDRGADRRVEYCEQIDTTHIWKMRRLLEGSLKNQTEIGDYADFQVRLVRVKGQPRAVLTTTTFFDALLLTLTVDRVVAAKVQKCARPDCGVVFAVSSGHERKYCERYCAHVESVRRDRARKKQKT